MMVKGFTIKSLDDIPTIANEVVDFLNLNKPEHEINCIAVYGEMGAGKTTFIKEICKALNVVDITSSPSFSLVNEYFTEAGWQLYHFDFYRINRKEEAFDFGYEEYFYSRQLCLIEWPEKIESLLPLPHIRLDIQIENKNVRKLHIKKIE